MKHVLSKHLPLILGFAAIAGCTDARPSKEKQKRAPITRPNTVRHAAKRTLSQTSPIDHLIHHAVEISEERLVLVMFQITRTVKKDRSTLTITILMDERSSHTFQKRYETAQPLSEKEEQWLSLHGLPHEYHVTVIAMEIRKRQFWVSADRMEHDLTDVQYTKALKGLRDEYGDDVQTIHSVSHTRTVVASVPKNRQAKNAIEKRYYLKILADRDGPSNKLIADRFGSEQSVRSFIIEVPEQTYDEQTVGNAWKPEATLAGLIKGTLYHIPGTVMDKWTEPDIR